MSVLPFVSVVIPSLDGKDLLADCLESLAKQTYPRTSFEIIVVDNGSRDGTSAWLAAEQPEIRVVRHEHNQGFAGGTNSGAAVAQGELLVFLNNDTVAEPTFIAALVDALGTDPTVAAAAARIVDWRGEQIEYAGGSIGVFGGGFQHSSWQEDFVEPVSGTFVPFACGGAMVVRADAFSRVGGFDEDFFAYYEDVDLGWRLWLSGYRVVYARSSEVRHRRHATGVRLPSRVRHMYWYRNSLLTLLKNADDTWLTKVLPYALSIAVSRIGLLYDEAANVSRDGRPEDADDFLNGAIGAGEGLSWVLTNLDQVRQKRERVQQERSTSDRSLADLVPFAADFGPEGSVVENALALRLLPFLDLSGLLSRQGLENAVVQSAHRVAGEAAAASALRDEVLALRRELDQRNHETARLHHDLHGRNIEVDRLHDELHARNIEAEHLHRDLQQLSVEAAALASQFNAVMTSKSWRWTAPIRALFRSRDPR